VSVDRAPREGIVLCSEEELERCQTVFEEVGVDANGNRIMAIRQGRLWKKEEGSRDGLSTLGTP
jgi:hypothetical protein